MAEKTELKAVREGIPMTEDEIKDWQSAFTEVLDSIEELYKEDGRKKNEK